MGGVPGYRPPCAAYLSLRARPSPFRSALQCHSTSPAHCKICLALPGASEARRRVSGESARRQPAPRLDRGGAAKYPPGRSLAGSVHALIPHCKHTEGRCLDSGFSCRHGRHGRWSFLPLSNRPPLTACCSFAPLPTPPVRSASIALRKVRAGFRHCGSDTSPPAPNPPRLPPPRPAPPRPPPLSCPIPRIAQCAMKALRLLLLVLLAR